MEHRIGWEDGREAWVEASRFFARTISDDPAYISHGEIQTGLSLDGTTWIADLEARFLAEAGADDEPRSLAIVRDTDGRMIAAAAVSWSFELPEARFATLQDMSVDAEFRSHGIGVELTAFVEAEAWRRGARWVFLESGKNNVRAHHFFERCGFEEISHVYAKRAPS